MTKEVIIIPVLTFPNLGGARSAIHEYWRALEKKYRCIFLTAPPKKDTEKYEIFHLSVSPWFPHPFFFLFIPLFIFQTFVMLFICVIKYKPKAIIPMDF